MGPLNKNLDDDSVLECNCLNSEEGELKAAKTKAELAAKEFANRQNCIQLEGSIFSRQKRLRG